MGLGVLPYHAARWVTAGLPPGACLRFGEALADWQYRLSASDRAIVGANLSVVMGRPTAERSAEVHGVFRHFGRYLTEFLLAHRWGRAGFRVDGCDELLERFRPHRSVIVLSAHIGNWELGGMAMGWLGLPVSVVALPHRDPAVDRLFNRPRQQAGVGVIPLNVHATRRCLERLRAGGVVCLLGDREFSAPGVAVSCFGRAVSVPRGPALLSLRTGAPMVPVFCIREGPRHLRFYTEPAIPPSGEPDPPTAVRQMMQQYADVLERYLRRFPAQWLMFESRFGS